MTFKLTLERIITAGSLLEKSTTW